MSHKLCDEHLIQYVSQRNDLSLKLLNEVTNRRGAKMLKLSSGDQIFGLKVATDLAISLTHESNVLQELDGFAHHLYVDSGTYEELSWMLQRWIGGQSASRRVKQLKVQSSDNPSGLIDLFSAMYSKVADLHTLGYVHGDLQPNHFRIGDDGTIYLLDFALTHCTAGPFDYQGALVHFSAPEVCKQQLEGSSTIKYDELAELYSLASVVFFLYTGQVSCNYGDANMQNVSLDEKRQCIARGDRNTFANVGCEPFEAIELILEKCLAINKNERYSSVKEALQDFYTLLDVR